MNINSQIDSNAIALDTRNFGVLSSSLTKDWMMNLCLVKESKLKHPQKAIIEIINSCNLDCPMCRVGQYGVNYTRILPLTEFKKIISQINKLETVRLNGLGESTLVPNFDEYLDFLFEKDLRVELITNGTGKNEVYRRILHNSGAVIISWDAAEPEIFEKLRRPAKWDKSVENLKKLTSQAASTELDKISLLFTLQKENINQLSKLVVKCSEWNIRNIIVNCVKDNDCEWGNSRIKEITQEFITANNAAKKNKINLFIPSQVFGNNLDLENSYSTNNENCRIPWKEVVIRWNGDVQVCNMFNPFVYGNIYLNSFNDIWNNLFANLFRKMSNTDKKHPYCINCVYFDDAYKLKS